MSPKAPRLSIIILAAGASQRLGQPKQLVQYKGRSLVQRAIQNAESVSPHEILVITGADAEAVQAEVQSTSAQCVQHTDWYNGMATSIGKGAQSVDEGSEGLMILLCDQWRIQPEDLQLLVQTWHNDPTQIVCAVSEDRRSPPVIFPSAFLPELRVMTGDHGAYKIIQMHPDSVSQVKLENAAFDLDTSSQLDELNSA